MKSNREETVDILMIAEGTYPYIRGGVSSWIDQIITGMPEYSFGILFLGSKREDYEETKYDLPDNVKFFETYFLFDPLDVDEPSARNIKKESMDRLKKFYQNIRQNKKFDFASLIDEELLSKDITINDFLYADESWEFIKENYRKNCPTLSFIDYFWSIRSIHRPVWLLTQIAQKMNFAKVIHSPSTGYAGFLATLISNFHSIPFILTEHGIYIRERKMDMHTNSSFELYKSALQKSVKSNDYIKQMWINFFEKMGYLTYQSAQEILSLFNGAKDLQIKFGADEKRCRVIPNGVDVHRLNKLVSLRDPTPPKVITLLGRVVSIKDIKTFIRAIRITADRFPDVQGWVVGPTDEDVIYADECNRMVESMNLKDNINFLGFQKIDDILPKSGILTLTSISEGMPLTILEGFASGLPCVATDVGSCTELIYGALNEEDIAISKAGEVVSVSNPSELAEAYIMLLEDVDLWKKYQKSALQRVNTFYTQEIFFKQYRGVYEKALAQWQG